MSRERVNTTQVPFLDLKAQYREIRDEIDEVISRVVESTRFAGGPFVEEFEEHFAEYCGCGHAVGVGSGTEALWLAMLALGVGPGDEVVTVPNSFIATAEAVSFCGARPVFVDVDESTLTMDPDVLESAITEKTRAIVPVHLFGQTADMDPILKTAGQYNIPVIEDACQAHGADYKSRRTGSLGDAACFSFYPGKNLGGYGESGCVTTSSREIARAVRQLRDHGQSAKYCHDVVGWNARMDGIQGAVLDVKLRYLDLGCGEGSFPKAERAARKLLSLPMYPELAEEQVAYVCRMVADAVERSVEEKSAAGTGDRTVRRASA
jgi:dTDP-4-amino-4,6-dideoxygalactose transaminase